VPEFLDRPKRLVVKRRAMKKRTNSDLCLEKQLKDPDVAFQLVSLRRKAGLSQKEPSYEGHSLSMLRRVAEVLGAAVQVDIRQKSAPPQWVVDEGRPSYRDKKSNLLQFELNLLRKEKVDYGRNFRIVDALYNEALALGALPSRNPLDGIEVDLRIAKVVNSV
jgi:hypothetical protein